MKVKILPQLKPLGHAMAQFECSDWEDLSHVLTNHFLQEKNFVWRGQRKAEWKLESTLERQISKATRKPDGEITSKHLQRFRYATRGRRGPFAQKITAENDWWALGQHYGLATPLLDWTQSPFVATYFALFKQQEAPAREGNPEKRAVYALDQTVIETRSDELLADNPDSKVIRFVVPDTEDNARLLSQAGLFTNIPSGFSIESWIEKHFAHDFETIALVKILIAEEQRVTFLKMLDYMNINHATLFPDVYGSATWCNRQLEAECTTDLAIQQTAAIQSESQRDSIIQPRVGPQRGTTLGHRPTK